MKTKLFALLILLSACRAYAASDRFGSMRIEIPRSSYTETADLNVSIATVTVSTTTGIDYGGSLVLRAVIFSGVVPSTIAFYDDTQFNNATTTRTKVSYHPTVGVAGSNARPVRIDFDMFFSSGLMYNKIGLAQTTILWDWLSPSRAGDSRR